MPHDRNDGLNSRWRRRRLSAALLAGPLCLAAAPAAAQSAPCAPYAEIVKQLSVRWGERRAGVGVHAGKRTVIELWVGEASGSFTILRRGPRVACVLSVGHAWQPVTGSRPGEKL